MKNLSVVIPSRNGLEILKKYLPEILDETLKAQGEVIVVDDCSEDDTCIEIAELFPDVTVLARKQNPGFCHAVNLGMSAAEGRFLLILNNDTIPEKEAFGKLVLALENSDENVAVAVPSIIRPDGSDDGSYRWIFRHGLAVTGENLRGEEYPSGACALWKRGIWEELGGFSSRFAPIYWEDTDLGVRMHSAGYVMKRCRNITVKHMHAATMGNSPGSDTLRERNRFIFMYINCNSKADRYSRIFWLPVHLILACLNGNRAFTTGYRNYLKWKREQQ